MELHLLRHAIAVDRGTSGYEDDSQRPLTPQGRRKMERVAKGMRALKLSFDVIFSSPYVRAHETAEIVADAFRLRKKLKLIDELAADGDPVALLAILTASGRAPASVLLVGHEPYLSQLAGVLIAGRPPARLKLKKAGLCKLDVTGKPVHRRCAELEWLLTPRQLAELA